MFWPVTQLASGETGTARPARPPPGWPSRPNGIAAQDRTVELGVVGLAPRPGAAGKLDRAGGDAVDPDALCARTRGCGPGVFQDRRLDGAVGRRAHRGVKPRDRRDVEDRARPRFFEVGNAARGRPHGRHQVDRDAAAPARLVVGGAEAGGVVDENVDAAEGLGRFRDIARDRSLVGEVADSGMRLGPAAMSARVASRASAPRAQIDTAAPASAKASAIARPMPRLPPQMTARLPGKSIFMAAPPLRCETTAAILRRTAGLRQPQRAGGLPLTPAHAPSTMLRMAPPPPLRRGGSNADRGDRRSLCVCGAGR